MDKSAFKKIKIALDTNVLSYLLDNTYENLTSYIQKLNSYDFVEMECSKFAIYELIGIRKLEHYIRKINEESQKSSKVVNFSSVFKYRAKWNAPELPYKDCWRDIKKEVENELNRLTNEFDIRVSGGDIHRDVWKPHQDLVLSSKISKEDSMVLISSAFPDIGKIEEHLLFLTNDNDFYNDYCGKETQYKEDGSDPDLNINSIFNTYSIEKPIVYNLNTIPSFSKTGKKTFNLIKDKLTNDEIEQYIKHFLLNHFEKRNSQYYLGKIITCKAKNKKDLLCFRLDTSKLDKNIYLTIVTKNLEFINIPSPQCQFWAHGEIKTYPHTPNQEENSREIAIKLLKEDKSSLLSQEQWDKILVNGNLVLVHPHS